MPTQCIFYRLQFRGFDSHKVVAGLDGGAITSDAGALLRGPTDQVSARFVDRRRPDLMVHGARTLVGDTKAVTIAMKNVWAAAPVVQTGRMAAFRHCVQ